MANESAKLSSSQKKQSEFEVLVAPHLDGMFGFAFSLVRDRAKAEDLVQESAMKAYRSFDQFEQGTNIKAWLFKILKNTFISQWRKNKKEVQSDGQDTPDTDSQDFSFYNAAYEVAPKTLEGAPDADILDPSKLEHVLGDEVTKALETLSEDFREVIYLCDIQGLSYQEIAEIMGIPIGTVRSRLARARTALQKMLWEYAKDKGLWRRKAS